MFETFSFNAYDTIQDKRFLYKEVEVDTVFEGSLVSFEATQTLDSYEWRVGGDSRTWNTKKFSLSFLGYLNNNITFPVSIDIILKGKRTKTEKDSLCNKQPKYEETITKRLVILPHNSDTNDYRYYTNPAFLGEYEGYSSDKPTEKYTMKIATDPDMKDIVYFDNFNNGCRASNKSGYYNPGFYDISYTAGTSKGISEGSGLWANCNLYFSIFSLNKAKDSINIIYTKNESAIQPSDPKKHFKTYTFKGKKIK